MIRTWTWASKRRRPHRVERKLVTRGGRLHFPSAAERRCPLPNLGLRHAIVILTSRHKVVRAPSDFAALVWHERYMPFVVARTEVGPEVGVSTVFLGISVGRRDELFETMVFGGPLHLSATRYASWTAAQEGHADLVKSVEERLDAVQVLARAESGDEELWAQPAGEPDTFIIREAPVTRDDLHFRDLVRCAEEDGQWIVVDVIQPSGWVNVRGSLLAQDDQSKALVATKLAEGGSILISYEGGEFKTTHPPEANAGVLDWLNTFAESGLLSFEVS